MVMNMVRKNSPASFLYPSYEVFSLVYYQTYLKTVSQVIKIKVKNIDRLVLRLPSFSRKEKKNINKQILNINNCKEQWKKNNSRYPVRLNKLGA